MKHAFYLTILFLCTLLIYSCSADDEILHSDDFETSKRLWESFKKSNNNSYKYIVTGESWTGTAWKTTITVKGGVISERHFQYTSPERTIDYVPQEDREWTENFDEINTHPSSPAGNAMTLDEVYLQAKTDWLLNRENTSTYFEAENNGLISYCGYVKDGCMDDCFIGIIIEDISPL